ncbi:HD domain-containing protein, partial [Paracoccaceae bacterium]|nr:HD domain-containing protein [Paracoccaceae bacterium]
PKLNTIPEFFHGWFSKRKAQKPYTIYLEEVAALVERWSDSESAIAAAWLHDTVEDCPPTSVAELESLFGNFVSDIVAELTEDKSLPKADRKKLQIINAAKKSKEACLVKLADKTSNIGAIANSPPEDWTLERRLKYIAWANSVVGQLPYLPKDGVSEFLKRCDQAELNAYDDLGSVRQAQNAAISILGGKAKRAGADEAQIRKFMLSFMQGAL